MLICLCSYLDLFFLGPTLTVATIAVFLRRLAVLTGMNSPVPASRPRLDFFSSYV